MSDLPPPDRNPLGALPAAWILGIGLLGTGVVVGRRLLLPAFGLPSAWYVLPVVAPYLLLGVAAILARRDRFVLVASVACLGLGCVAALLAAGAFGLNQAWQRGISGVGGSGSGEEASGWLVVALLQGGLALLADRLLARSTKVGERIILYLMSAAVLFVLVKGAMDDIADRRRPLPVAPPEAVAINQAVQSNEHAVAAAMLWIHGAAQRYRLRHRDAGYPASLADIARDEALGDKSSPPAFKAVLATGVWSGYRVQYRALPGGDGVVKAYELTAIPLPPADTPKSPQAAGFLHGARSYFSDQTGELHWARGTVGAGSPVESIIGHEMGQARLLLDNDWVWQGGFPAELRSDIHFAADYGYLLTYRPERGAAGLRDKFRLEARPFRYGETGLRSYLLDESGVVHATPEPRPARLDDPMADDCELDESARTCSVRAELVAGERSPRPAGDKVAGVTDDGTVVVTNSPSGIVSATDPLGQVLWQLRGPSGPVIVGKDAVYVAADMVWAISTRGAARWRVRPPGGDQPRMALAPDGTLILLTSSTLQAIDGKGGERWRQRLSKIIFNGDRATVQAEGEEVSVLVRGATSRYALSDGRQLAP